MKLFVSYARAFIGSTYCKGVLRLQSSASLTYWKAHKTLWLRFSFPFYFSLSIQFVHYKPVNKFWCCSMWLTHSSSQGIAMDFEGLSRIGLGFGFVRELKAKLNFTHREREREILIRSNVGLMSLMSCRGLAFHCGVRITKLPPRGVLLCRCHQPVVILWADWVSRHWVLFSLPANKEQQAKYWHKEGPRDDKCAVSRQLTVG